MDAGAGAGDPIAGVLLALAVMLVVAKLGGDLMIRLGLPAMLGELGGGILLGNLGLVGFHALDFIPRDPHVSVLADIGAVLLLFESGLGLTVKEMLAVGFSAMRVAVLGVVGCIALGTAAAAALMRAPHVVPFFVGAAIASTSAGISARVLKDLGRPQSAEARLVLGAAVIDDVLGLVALASLTALLGEQSAGVASAGGVLVIAAKAAGFLVGALVVGSYVSPRMLRFSVRLRGPGLALATALVLCFLFAWGATLAGLSPIIGAFAAGLVLEPMPEVAGNDGRDPVRLDELLAPIGSFLVPIFFVVIGTRVDIAALAHLRPLALSGALAAAAFLGKQACALGVSRRSGVDRLAVGIAMVPHGEVTLIFASIGATLVVGGHPVVGPDTFSALVMVVVLTTLATPLLLRWRMGISARA